MRCCAVIGSSPRTTARKGLIGVFQSFQFPSVPSPAVSWFIYGSLGSVARGTPRIQLRHHARAIGQSSDEVVSGSGEIRVTGDREDVELVLPVTCAFHYYGAHVVTLEVGDELVASRILRVIAPANVKPARSGNGASS